MDVNTYSQCPHDRIGVTSFHSGDRIAVETAGQNYWTLLAETGWIQSQRSKQRDSDDSSYLFDPWGHRGNIIPYL